MKLRGIAAGVALAVLGLAVAVAIGLASNAISGDTVGLSAEPLKAGETLAPTKANDPAADRRRTRRQLARKRLDKQRRDELRGSAEATPATGPASADETGVDDSAGSHGSDDSSGHGSSDDRGGGSEDSSGSGSGSSDDSGGGGSDD